MDMQTNGRGPAPTLCVAMPALDEAEGIAVAVQSGSEALERLCSKGVISGFELVVIDDGSTDATASRVEEAATELAHVRLLHHDRNRGVGAALQTAIAATTCDLLLATDADMPVDLDRLADAVPLLGEGVGMVAGHRSSFDQEPIVRRIASRTYDRVAQLAFGVRMPDVNFPFKLLATDTARSLDIRSEGALVDVEMLAKVKGRGLRIVSLEMAYHARTAGESKTMRPGVLVPLVREMITHRSELRTGSARRS